MVQFFFERFFWVIWGGAKAFLKFLPFENLEAPFFFGKDHPASQLTVFFFFLGGGGEDFRSHQPAMIFLQFEGFCCWKMSSLE